MYRSYGSSGSGEIVGIIITVIIVLVGIFFACRELMCWYYKINKIISLMEEQNNLLKHQMGISPTSAVHIPSADDWVCPKCKNNNRKTALFCNNCGEKK